MLKVTVATFATLSTLSFSVLAQNQEMGIAADPTSVRQLEEVVVTAQHREQSLQDVPISVNAVAGESLKARGINSITSLAAAVPGLDVPMVGSVASPYLRGIGSNAADPNNEPSVAMYVDGIYLAAPFTNIFSFNNIERVEVLKGPQGTLFGRNATGGVIQVLTKEPSHEPALETTLGYGNYDTLEAGLYGTTGLTDNLAIDLAVQHKDQGDGWGKSRITGRDVYKTRETSARTKVVFTPVDSTKVIASFDYADKTTSVGDYQLPKGVAGLDGEVRSWSAHDTYTAYPYSVNAETYGTSLRIEQDIGFADLISMTGYRKSEGLYAFDADATPTDFVTAMLYQKVEGWTQEFQLMGSGAAMEWLVGLFYFDNEAKYDPGRLSGLAIGPDALELFGTQKTESWSVYGQSTFDVTDAARITAGLRYTDEEQSLDSAVGTFELPQTENSFEELTWRVAFDYTLTDHSLAYISYNRGIKSGGFDILSPGNTGYDPEILDAYEVGIKSELLDQRVRFNAAVFYYDYEDMQVTSIQQNTTSTANAAGARIKGIDIDIEALATEHLTLTAGLALLDGEYTDFPNPVVYPASPGQPPVFLANAKGNDTIRTPEFTGNIGAQYLVPTSNGNVSFGGNISFNDGFFWAPDERYKQDSYILINGSVTWTSPSEQFDITLWGENLSDEEYMLQGVPSAYGDLMVIAAPRTYGIRFGTRF